LEPDLIVVFSMSHLLKENVFNAPFFIRTVNIHYPKYRSTLLKKSSICRLVFSLRILDYKKRSTSGYKVGNIYKEKSGYFLACRDRRDRI